MRKKFCVFFSAIVVLLFMLIANKSNNYNLVQDNAIKIVETDNSMKYISMDDNIIDYYNVQTLNKELATTTPIDESSTNTFNFNKRMMYPAIFIAIYIISFIITILIISSISKVKVLKLSLNKIVYFLRNVFLSVVSLSWFILGILLVVKNTDELSIGHFEYYLIGYGVGGIILFIIMTVITSSILKSNINKKVQSLNNLHKGMTYEEVCNTLELELKNKEFVIVRPYRNGKEIVRCTLHFDSEGRYINYSGEYHRRWYE